MRNVIIKSRTCRKCKVVEKYLEEHPRNDIEMLFAESDEGRELAINNKVKAAPTLLVFGNEGELITSMTGDQEIIAYLDMDRELDDEIGPINV